MAWDVAKFLQDKYIKSLTEIESKIPRTFVTMAEILKDEGFCLLPPTPSFISDLYYVNDALAEWRISTERSKGMRQIFHHFSPINKTNDRLNSIIDEFKKKLRAVQCNEVADSSTWLNNRTIFPSDPDRSTCFVEPDSSNILGFDEPAKKMLDWLSASGEGSKIMGVHGMGGSGKTTLVNKVLLQKKNGNPSVSDDEASKHKILWTCLSDLTCEAEIDVKIIQHLLDCLDFDIDELHLDGSGDDKIWLKEQLKDKLQGCESYILVFDDVWVCNDWFIDLCRELAEPKHKGGAVIVTSRIKEVATKLVGGEHKLIHLKPSMNGEFLEAMVKQNIRDHQILDVDDIVRHCHGLPQAATTLPNNIVEPKPKLE